jgi:3-dehydroquinate synthase
VLQLGSLASHMFPSRRVALVSSRRVFGFHGSRVEKEIRRAGLRITRILIPDGEGSKTLKHVEKLYGQLARAQFERQDPMFVLGGGTLGDAAGFAASTYLRGMPLVHIPTTLLAQVDSAIGGKTGVNLGSGKNQVGAIWQPAAVVCDTQMLTTLPRRQLASGLAEVVKYACIARPTLLRTVTRQLDLMLSDRPDVSVDLVAACARIKADVVSRDEREGDLRRILNFGHTFGHAVEKLSNYRLLHGEAVALGMLVALELSIATKGLDAAWVQSVYQCLKGIFPRLVFPATRSSEVSRAMAHDKKVQSGKSVWILLRTPGEPVTHEPPTSAVRAAISRARSTWNVPGK